MDQTLEFEQATCRINRDTLIDSLEAAKKGDAKGQVEVAAAMTWTAFACPDAINAVYDNIACVWLGSGEQPEIAPLLPEAPLESAFWESYWAVIEDSKRGVVPSKAENQVADLALASNPSLIAIAEQGVTSHPRLGTVLVEPTSSGLDPDVLRRCPNGSLGQTLYQMIVGHGYSQRLVDTRLQQFSLLPESLRRLYSRVAQMHRPWNMVAGYDAGDSHQIAYGGFQLAQFGLAHAAMILASFATISCFLAPTGFYILLYLIAEGWRHGQETPDFLGIDWSSEWDHSIETIRERHGISAFRSVFSRNLFEVFGTPRD